MYFAEHIRGGRDLLPGQFFDLNISAGGAGKITVMASVRRRSLDVSAAPHYLVELFAAGADRPVAASQIEGAGQLSIFEFDSSNGGTAWTARITNCNSHPLQVDLAVAYPGSGQIQERMFPAHFVEAIASRLLAATTVHLHHGANASSIQFAPLPGVRDFRFSIPRLDCLASPPLLPEIHVVEQVHDIRSNSFKLRLFPGSVANPGGTLRLEFGFEECEAELVGSFPVPLSQKKLLVELDLGVAGNRIAYNNVRATFDLELDIRMLPVWMYNPIFDFRDRLQDSICASVRAAFNDADTREAFIVGFEQGLETVLGPGARAVTVQMENGQVCLGLFRPRQAAVA